VLIYILADSSALLLNNLKARPSDTVNIISH
jgi:hypothetical protein